MGAVLSLTRAAAWRARIGGAAAWRARIGGAPALVRAGAAVLGRGAGRAVAKPPPGDPDAWFPPVPRSVRRGVSRGRCSASWRGGYAWIVHAARDTPLVGRAHRGSKRGGQRGEGADGAGREVGPDDWRPALRV